MIKQLSTFITEYLGRNNASLNEKDILKIKYTLEVILGDSSKFILIFLIFLILKEIPLFLLSFIILNSTRPLVGGLHCKTYSSCLFVSLMYFLTILLFSKLSVQFNISFYVVFFILSFIIVLTCAPCRNEKRPIKNKSALKILSLVSLSFWCILFFTLSDLKICNCIFASIFFQISQIIIITMKGGNFYDKIYKRLFNYAN